MKKKYIAIKKVRGVEDGAEFTAPRNIGRALVAVGRAEPVEDEYSTTNDPAHLTKVVEPSRPEPNKQALENTAKTDDQPDDSEKVETDSEQTNDDPEINATPNAIEAAKEHNIDLNQIVGSGENGRVTKTDVMAVVKTNENTGI